MQTLIGERRECRAVSAPPLILRLARPSPPVLVSPAISGPTFREHDRSVASINYPRLTGERERQTAIITTTINAPIIRQSDRGHDCEYAILTIRAIRSAVRA